MNNKYADCSIEQGHTYLMQKLESKNKGTAGERGESGENPHECLKVAGRNGGESGRFSPLAKYKQPVYPVDALDSLAGVCVYMRDEMQLPAETAGQSLLAVASLLAQGLYEVKTLAGVKPLSLNLLTLADSGDGKSTADGVALRVLHDADRLNHANFEKKMTAWSGLSKKEREAEPQPIAPYRMLKSGTIQGIVRSFKEGVSSQGSFTAEAASMLAGWGLSSEQKRNTLAGLNDFWDGSPVSIVRQGEGRTQMYDKRFCCHWLIQPSAAHESLNDDLFATIGTWPRFLVAWPAPMSPRSYKRFAPGDSEAVQLFWERCGVLLNQRYSVPEGGRNVIILSDKARVLLVKFWEAMEKSRDPESDYYQLKPFCVRGAEQVCRIAGVLAAFRNHSAGKTDFQVLDADISNAIKLFTYSLNTWLGIFGTREDLEQQAWANNLYDWIKKQPDGKASQTAMLKIAPKSLRSRHKRDTALAILQASGRIRRVINILPSGAQQISNDEWSAI
jgi:hypothetical protein